MRCTDGYLYKTVSHGYCTDSAVHSGPIEQSVWVTIDTTGGIDTVDVQGYTNDALLDYFDDFLADAATPKVLRYAETCDQDLFTHLNYVRGLNVRLHPQRTFTAGVLTSVDYYANVSFDVYGQEVFDDLVVREVYAYTRNSDGFAVSRNLTIKWITEANTEHAITKERYKTYNLMESIRETNRRRANILDELKSTIIGMMVASMPITVDQAIQSCQTFFEYHINNIMEFKEIGEVQTLIDAVHTWLDNVVAPPSTTMRQYITTTLAGAILVGT